MGNAPSLLSMVKVTSARPSGGRSAVPAKMTSSILPPRSALAPCSPITQDSASTTLDLPDPLGPTTQVMPGSKRNVVAEAKDLKPFSVKLFKCTVRRALSLLRYCMSEQGTGGPARRTARSALDEAGDAANVVKPLGHLLHVPGRRVGPEHGKQALACFPRPLGNHFDSPV